MATSTAGSRRASGGLLLYHFPVAPWFRNASTILEHVGAFRRHSEFPIWELNVDEGFPPALESLEFDAVILHYSIFGMHHYWPDDAWRDWLSRSGAYKVAFFQDEYFACGRRFDFLNEHRIDCVYTCLEPSEFDKVYGRYTSVPKLVSNLPGYAPETLPAAASRFARPDDEREIDIGYRGRPLPAYMGRGAQEKHLIGERFRELAADSGLRLDLAGSEAERLYGDDWYRFMGSCRCVLGVESGVSAFDLEGEVYAEYERKLADGPVGVDDLESLARWEDVVYYRTASPRHFEAAAFRCAQILFEGRYSGAMQPGKHYIELKKDFSNLDEVIGLARDRSVRRELTEMAYRDLIASGDWSYERLVSGLDETLREAGVGAAGGVGVAEVDAAIARGARARHARRVLEWALRAVLASRPVRRAALMVHPLTSRARRLLGRPSAAPSS